MIYFTKLTETARVPVRASAGAAGLDLYSDETVTVPEYFRAWVSTGIAISLYPFHVGLVRPRSGMAGHGWDVGAGVIDSDYRGEVKVLMCNNSPHQRTVHAGDRIAQLLILPVAKPELVEVDTLPATERGAGGFGSTGT